MKLIRAPLRVSLFGGGTDLDPYCATYGSTIISFAIDRYIYLSWNPRPTGGCRLSYSQVEELETLKDAEHTLVRQAARVYGFEEPCTMTIVSDVPKGTGLGSSSALAVCLVKLVRGEPYGASLVKEAHELEQAHSLAGWQDYLPAVCSGFNVYRIDEMGFRVGIEEDPMTGTGPFRTCPWDIINRYGMLFYTGGSRKADDVLGSWQKSDEQLHKIKALADEVAEQIDDITPEHLAQYLNATWEMKRSIPGVTSPSLNRQYALAMMNGALGGKLCGAGQSGCWFFLVPPHSTTRAKVRNVLGLKEIPFKIAEKGVEVKEW